MTFDEFNVNKKKKNGKKEIFSNGLVEWFCSYSRTSEWLHAQCLSKTSPLCGAAADVFV